MSRRMSKSEFGLEKLKMRMNAANAKPERPRWDEQMRLEKSLGEIQDQSSSRSKKIQEDMFNELGNKWKGQGGGSSGDAFVTGLTAGIKEGSFLDDKKRSQKLAKFTEQMRDLVADQNVKLFEAEKLHNAKASMAPRIMAYMDRYKTMSPNDRKVYLQNAMEEFNQAAGTDYKLIDTNGAEPWKIMVSDGEGIVQEDLFNFIKTPDEKRYEYYLNSEEARNYEKDLEEEDALERQILENKATHAKYKADSISPEKIQEKKKQLIESGQIPKGAILFDELPKDERKVRFEFMKSSVEKKKDTENALEALEGIGKVLKNNPNISTSFAKWANETDDGLAANFLRKISDQKVRSALKELEKHAGVLAVGAVQQFKGQRPTDVLKKLLISTVPGKDFTYDAYKAIAPSIIKRMENQLKESIESQRGFDNRYVPAFINSDNDVKEIPAQESERDKIIREIQEIEARRKNG